MKCYVCGDVTVKRHGRSNMCAKHVRFSQMQKTARQDEKYVPPIYELESLVPADMVCPDCGVLMHWIDDDNRAAGAILQHYRDNTLGIVCASCNTKHGLMPGDSYRELPEGHKYCPTCKTIKPLDMFYVRRDGVKEYPMTKCKPCNRAAHKKWREANPTKYADTNKRNNNARKINKDQ